MSIKHFTHQDCPVCKEETTHNACVCIRCGHTQVTPTEVRRKAFRRLYLKYKKVYGNDAGLVLHRQGKKGKPAYEGPTVGKTPNPNSVFGRGKERKKI